VSEPVPSERLWNGPFLVCTLVNGLQGLAFNLFLHLPGFLEELGASAAGIGFLFSLGSLASILVRPAVGSLMDTRGRRGVVLAGNALNVASVGAYLTVGALGAWLVAVRVAHGLAEALLFTALFTLAADWAPARRRTQALALFGVSGMLPISLGGLLGDAILARAGYRELFATALAFAVLALAFSLGLRERPRDPGAASGLPHGFRATLVRADLLPLWWITTVFSAVIAAFFGFVKLFVEATGLGSVGLFFSSYTAVALALRIGFGWLPDRIGAKRVLFPALAALGVGCLLLAGAGSARDVAVAGALCGFGHGYTFPILFGILVGRAPEADRGSAMAIYTALFDVGMLVAAPTLGLVIDRFGFGEMFVAAAGILVAGALVYAIWDRRR
jgi:MFS family permease